MITIVPRKKKYLKQLNFSCILICLCFIFIIEIVSGQIAEFKYKTIQQEMHDYAQIKYIQNTRSNLLCASTCSKQPLCNMYMFDRSNHMCSIYTFNMTGSNIMCTGNAVCYLRSLQIFTSYFLCSFCDNDSFLLLHVYTICCVQ